MKLLTTILFLAFTSSALAQQCIIYKGNNPITDSLFTSLLKIDLDKQNGQFDVKLPRDVPTIDFSRLPALYDGDRRVILYYDEFNGLTGIQLEQLLMDKLEQRSPAQHREYNKGLKQEAREAAGRAANANSIPALRVEVERLSEIVEYLLEKIYDLEQQFDNIP